MRDDLQLKNYTSGVAAERTIARIEEKLSRIGASAITKHYGLDRRVAAILFHIEVAGKNYVIRLPANVDACFELLWKDHCKRSVRVHPGAKERIREQAERTVWKLMQDWVDVQVSHILLRQADWLQVFMSYIYDGARQQTFYDLMKNGGFAALPCKPVAQLSESSDQNEA